MIELGSFNDTQNKAIVANTTDTLKLNPLTDKIPKQIIPSVQPVFEVNNRCIDVCFSTTKATTGTATIGTLQNRIFLLKYVCVSMVKDVACDIQTGRVSVSANVGGVTQALCGVSSLTLTAQNQTIAIFFDTPIRIDASSPFVISGTATSYAAGVCVRNAEVGGYYEDSVQY